MVVPGMTQLLSRISGQLDELELHVTSTWPGLVEPLERMLDEKSRVWRIVQHLKARGEGALLCYALLCLHASTAL